MSRGPLSRAGRWLLPASLVLALGLACGPRPETHPRGGQAAPPLPSWNDGAAKAAILRFVSNVTTLGGPGYVPVAERIAVFDNDGTLWAEQPTYFQLMFAFDRVKALAPRHPEWRTQAPFKAVLAGDMDALAAGGERAVAAVIAASHSGLTTDEFGAAARDWLRTARHPKTGTPLTDLVYAPMLELLDYLRANGFKTFIVSGGGVEFIRAFADSVYGIPPEQVIGSQGKLRFEMRDGKPVLVKLAELQFVDDGPGKPVAIQTIIGRRPIAAFGNSDGDREMLEWTWAGPGARLALLVHHTDAGREWAYDRASPVGRLDKALDEAQASGWTVVDMKADWKQVFAPR
jgi:phosphoglycolate phosphatase-like HAD superfamily hydrolase